MSAREGQPRRVRAAPNAVLFDLDGTLLDTAPDLARALNHVRAGDGLAPLPYALIRTQVSNGSAALIRLGYDFAPDGADFAARRERLLAAYRANLAVESRLFEGMDEVLALIEASGRPWGIVTNKPAWLTVPLLEATALSTRAACVISGDSTAHSKPHPQPLLSAAQELGIEPAQCLYVGDAERDVTAARAAGMPVLIALYGYIAPDERPQSWGAEASIAAPHDLMAWL